MREIWEEHKKAEKEEQIKKIGKTTKMIEEVLNSLVTIYQQQYSVKQKKVDIKNFGTNPNYVCDIDSRFFLRDTLTNIKSDPSSVEAFEKNLQSNFFLFWSFWSCLTDLLQFQFSPSLFYENMSLCVEKFKNIDYVKKYKYIFYIFLIFFFLFLQQKFQLLFNEWKMCNPETNISEMLLLLNKFRNECETMILLNNRIVILFYFIFPPNNNFLRKE